MPIPAFSIGNGHDSGRTGPARPGSVCPKTVPNTGTVGQQGESAVTAGYVYIALATLFFSTMEIALKTVAGNFNPIQLNFTRFLVGGLVLLPVAARMLRRRQTRVDAAALGTFAWLGFVGVTVSMTLYQLAVENANASVVAVLFSSNPVFVLLFAFLILHAAIMRQHVIALILECLGIVAIINPLHTDISLSGIVYTLLATITFALYGVLGARSVARFSGVVVTCGSFLCAALEMLALIALSHTAPVAEALGAHGLAHFADIPLLAGYNARSLWTMLYVSVGVTGAGYACYFMAIQTTSPIRASVVFFLKPALAPLLALLVLGESIPFHMAVGIVLILLGSLVSLLPILMLKRTARMLRLRRKLHHSAHTRPHPHERRAPRKK